jgi:hypothetical protein
MQSIQCCNPSPSALLPGIPTPKIRPKRLAAASFVTTKKTWSPDQDCLQWHHRSLPDSRENPPDLHIDQAELENFLKRFFTPNFCRKPNGKSLDSEGEYSARLCLQNRQNFEFGST